jgi:hypothetical protein
MGRSRGGKTTDLLIDVQGNLALASIYKRGHNQARTRTLFFMFTEQKTETEHQRKCNRVISI